MLFIEIYEQYPLIKDVKRHGVAKAYKHKKLYNIFKEEILYESKKGYGINALCSNGNKHERNSSFCS